MPADAKGSSDWSSDVAPFNTRLQYTPVAIVVPSTVAHVQAAVSCAAKLNIKVIQLFFQISGGSTKNSLLFLTFCPLYGVRSR